MKTILENDSIKYFADSDDWRLVVANNSFEIVANIEGIETLRFSSGINLDNLAKLIIDAKQDATYRGIDWTGNSN